MVWMAISFFRPSVSGSWRIFTGFIARDDRRSLQDQASGGAAANESGPRPR